MLNITQRLSHFHGIADDSVTLDFDTRQKARIKITTDKGNPAGIFVERGKPLVVGECLQSDCGQVIEIKGALEAVTTASTADWHTFAKVCYLLVGIVVIYNVCLFCDRIHDNSFRIFNSS